VDYSITMDKKNKQIQLDDNNEETSLFHAVDNIDLFSKLLTNSKIDVNQKMRIMKQYLFILVEKVNLM